jgi:hypothetical protein
VQRFPSGIVKGLNVVCDPPKEPDDFEAFKITEGFAVDESGNAIVVGSEGLRIPVNEFPEGKDSVFLSLLYTQKKAYIPNSSYDSSNKNNRMVESVKYIWDDKPVRHTTLAKIRRRNNGENIENKKTCRNGELIIEEDVDGQAIRIDAGIVEEEQLSDELKKKLVTGGDKHNHTGAHETRIPEGGLEQAVQDKLVTGGDEHNHTGDGARIPEAGLADEVTEQLVTQGDSHNHTGGHGAPIPEGGLTTEVQDKLVNGGNTHDHTGGGGAQIPRAGLADEVAEQLVTQGDRHNHTGGNGLLIPEAGLIAAVRAKLVNGGNTHDHSGSRGNPIPVEGLSEEVQEKLVTSRPVTPDESNTTIPPGARQTGSAIINRVEKNAIIHIVPTRGRISWTFTVEANEEPNEDFLKYTISVENLGDIEAEFEVRKFVFGAG